MDNNINKRLSGIYFFCLKVQCPVTGKLLYKIGRSENIPKRVRDESNEQTCIAYPDKSPDTMCILTTNDVEMETYIFRHFADKRIGKKEIFTDVTFNEIVELVSSQFDDIEVISYQELDNNLWKKISNGDYANARIVKGKNSPHNENGRHINRAGEISRINELVNRKLLVKEVIKINYNGKNKLIINKPITFNKEKKGIIINANYTMTDFEWDIQKGYVSVQYDKLPYIDELLTYTN